MLGDKTVFIVGAGASNELNFPLGSELKEVIQRMLDFPVDDWGNRMRGGDDKIYDALEYLNKEEPGSLRRRSGNKYVGAARCIKNAMPLASSIDTYIHHISDLYVEKCAKLAIVKSILDAERKSLLYVAAPYAASSSLNLHIIKDTWLIRLWKIVFGKVGDVKKHLSSAIFIVFNYDRCVEHFLFHALRTYYNIDEVTAASLVNNVAVYHPYGAVGSLPWCDDQRSIPFGSDTNLHKLIELSKQIKTFTESTNPDSSDIRAIRESINTAKKIVFLGFAFHPQNLDLLFPKGQQFREDQQIFATAFGISKDDVIQITCDLRDRGVDARDSRIRNDLKCCELFEEYGRSLCLAEQT